ncbi:MAG: hypothetical protein LC637_10440 [Xanthomonadaceae bacterium]|nr:hypothetical protein [Xanthomonadaceae bacterium]
MFERIRPMPIGFFIVMALLLTALSAANASPDRLALEQIMARFRAARCLSG